MSDRDNYERQFIVDKTYLTVEGKRVKIIAESTKHGPNYTCVQGDDGGDYTDNHGKVT